MDGYQHSIRRGIKAISKYSLCCVFVSASARRLLFVQAIWRHGDRSPDSKAYPGNPYDESYWPRGWNELTNLGMRQMKELGKFYRSRYDSFVGRIFKVKEIFVQSSEQNRALVSAQAFLNGFFPPYGARDEFESQLAWQPLPVHTTGCDIADPLLKPNEFYCPIYNRMAEATSRKLEIELNTRYGNFLDFVAPHINNGKRPTLKQIRKINDINREITHNLAQPPWLFHAFPEYGNKTVLELGTMFWKRHRIEMFQKLEMARLRGGFLLGDWLQRAERLMQRHNAPQNSNKNKKAKKNKKQKKDPKKMQLYSSHDGTILALLSTMGLNPRGDAIPYAASLIMEIYVENDERTLTVEIYYRYNYTLERLIIEGCGTPCELSKLIELYRSRAIFEIKDLYRVCFCSPNNIIERFIQQMPSGFSCHSNT